MKGGTMSMYQPLSQPQPDLPPVDPIRATPSFKIVRKGFDQEQVLGHLRLVGQRVSELESRLDRAQRDLQQARAGLDQSLSDRDQARRKVEELQQKIDSSPAPDDPYEGISEHVLQLVREFDRDVELLRGKADLESRRLVAEARTDAANKRIEAMEAEKEARGLAERLLKEAREEAANVKAELAPLREWTVSQAEAIRERMRTSLLELDAVMAEGSDQEPVIVVGEAQEGQPGETREDHAVPGDSPSLRQGM
jgi:DNA repair exonuclease SbcCD ATPase subunit